VCGAVDTVLCFEVSVYSSINSTASLPAVGITIVELVLTVLFVSVLRCCRQDHLRRGEVQPVLPRQAGGRDDQDAAGGRAVPGRDAGEEAAGYVTIECDVVSAMCSGCWLYYTVSRRVVAYWPSILLVGELVRERACCYAKSAGLQHYRYDDVESGLCIPAPYVLYSGDACD
jgi:hypothetical protein